MCFENLPITFDEAGRPRLVEGGFGLDRAPRGARPAPLPEVPRGRTFDIDPVTRVAGAMAFHTTVDLDERTVTSATCEAVMFRGYELILAGRDPVDAIDISSRACGVCGGVHSTCASMALEMVYGAVPPPLALIARNLAEAAELVYDHSLHLFLLAGPDYSEQVVARTNPRQWARAERTAAPNAAVHGMRTVAEIMRGLNPLRGALTLEALEVTRAAREIVSLIYGRYPHPSTIVPAGITSAFDRTVLNQVLARVVRMLDFAKRTATLWDDLVGFLYAVEPDNRRVGERAANLITTGIWDDPGVYDANYATVDRWGAARLCPPGVVIDGALRTDRLSAVLSGMEEFVSHSFYDDWAGTDPLRTAPDGTPLSPYHPLNKRTLPRPEAVGWRDRYSWSTAPRWDRLPMESGPLARQWTTVLAGTPQTDFMQVGPGRIELHVPAGTLPALDLQWRLPPIVNALERNRARAFHVAYCLMAAYSYLLAGFDRLRAGHDDMVAPFTPRDGMGIGIWEAGRGTLTHHCIVEDGRIASYQILTPSTWMASPRDPWEVPGPYEEAVLNTPILEEVTDPDEFTGIDILRAIRSFDPCLPCAVHLHTGAGTVIRDATTCACGADG
jgi:hydrogenase large subunit